MHLNFDTDVTLYEVFPEEEKMNEIIVFHEWEREAVFEMIRKFIEEQPEVELEEEEPFEIISENEKAIVFITNPKGDIKPNQLLLVNFRLPGDEITVDDENLDE